MIRRERASDLPTVFRWRRYVRKGEVAHSSIRQNPTLPKQFMSNQMKLVKYSASATMMNIIIISSLEGIVYVPNTKRTKDPRYDTCNNTILLYGWHRPVTGCAFQRLYPGIGEKAPVAILIKESK